MKHQQASFSRRSFLKTSALAGGGLMLSFGWIDSFASKTKQLLEIPEEWTTLNGYLKITADGTITIMSPNPEGYAHRHDRTSSGFRYAIEVC